LYVLAEEDVIAIDSVERVDGAIAAGVRYLIEVMSRQQQQ